MLVMVLAVGVWIPFSYAQNRVIQVLPSGDSGGAFLGIRMTDVTQENMSEYKLDNVQGVIVDSVVEGSPAEKAELKEKDVVLEFDGLKVLSTMQFSRLVRETPVGREVELLISRDGKRKNVTVQLAAREEQRAEGRSFVVPSPLEGRNLGNYFGYRFPDNSPVPFWDQGYGSPRLGISVQALTEQLAEYFQVPGKKGILVTSVNEKFPSAGKLQAGDVIIRAEGKAVRDPVDLTGIVQRATGEKISLDVIRDKKEIKVVINLSSDSGKEGGSGKEFKL